MLAENRYKYIPDKHPSLQAQLLCTPSIVCGQSDCSGRFSARFSHKDCTPLRLQFVVLAELPLVSGIASYMTKLTNCFAVQHIQLIRNSLSSGSVPLCGDTC